MKPHYAKATKRREPFRNDEYLSVKYVKNGQTDTIRLNWILTRMDFREQMKYGGDLEEMREGIDAAMSWEVEQ